MPTNGNRVTIRDVYTLLERQETKYDICLTEIRKQNQDQGEAITGLKVIAQAHAEALKTQDGDLRTLRNRSTWWESINSTLVVVAGIFGIAGRQ